MGLFDWLKKKKTSTDTSANHSASDVPSVRTIQVGQRSIDQNKGKISLGFHSICMPDGHAGTEVYYDSALRQVVVRSYSTFSDENIERIPIPEGIALRHSISEILEYAKNKNMTVRMVCK